MLAFWWKLNSNNPITGTFVALIFGLAVIWPLIDPGFHEANGYFGALVGSFFGLVAILVGALYNAHLTRLRDDRLRQEDVHATLTALTIEMQIFLERVRYVIIYLDSDDNSKKIPKPPITEIEIYNRLKQIGSDTELLKSESVLRSIGLTGATEIRNALISYNEMADMLKRLIDEIIKTLEPVSWTDSPKFEFSDLLLTRLKAHADPIEDALLKLTEQIDEFLGKD